MAGVCPGNTVGATSRVFAVPEVTIAGIVVRLEPRCNVFYTSLRSRTHRIDGAPCKGGKAQTL
jgi:hypothetical protein